jgi:hypothetical protein
MTASSGAAVSTRHVRLVRDAGTGVEAIEARFAAHAYDLHRHDEWLVGLPIMASRTSSAGALGGAARQAG